MTKLVRLFTFFACAVFAANLSNADDRYDRGKSYTHDDERGFFFAPEVGYVLPTDGNVDDTIFLGGRVGYDFDSNWGMDLESGWMRPSWDVSGGPQNTDIDVVPILVNMRYTGPRCEEWGWYLFGGIGAAINSVESNEADVEVDDGFAWQGGLGVDYLIGEQSTVFLDARYLWNNQDISSDSALIDRAIDDDADLSAVLFTTGVKF